MLHMRKILVILILSILTAPVAAAGLIPIGTGTVQSTVWYDSTAGREFVLVTSVTSPDSPYFETLVEFDETVHGDSWWMFLREDGTFYGWRGEDRWRNGDYVEGTYALTEKDGKNHLQATGDIRMTPWYRDFVVDVEWSA